MLLAIGGVVGGFAAVAGIAAVASRGSRGAASSPAVSDAGAEVPPAGPLVVDKPVVDLGRVPLGVAVPVSVTLTNRSDRTIRLGKPIAEVLEGC